MSSHSRGEAARFFKKIRRTANNISPARNHFGGFVHATANRALSFTLGPLAAWAGLTLARP